MKVLIVISGLELGGAEVQVCDLCDQLIELGVNVRIVALMGDVHVRPASSLIKIEHLTMRKNIISLYRSVHKYMNVVRDFQPDIIHSHLYHANIFTRIMATFTRGTPIINSEHSRVVGSALRYYSYFLTKWLPVICTNVSGEALNEYVSKGVFIKTNSKCIYNGIDEKKYRFSEESRRVIRKEFNVQEHVKVFMSVGRLVEAKDYPTLINAFNNINIEGTELWIVGDGKERGALMELAKKLGLEWKIKFLGARRDVSCLLSACDVFVLSSRWEGFPLVVVEAMASGRHVIATNAGGVREALPDNSKWLVNIGDVNQLSAKMSESLNLSDDDLMDISSSNRQRVMDNFSILSAAQNWLCIYMGILH